MGKCKKKSKWMRKHCCATCKQVIDASVGAGKVNVKIFTTSGFTSRLTDGRTDGLVNLLMVDKGKTFELPFTLKWSGDNRQPLMKLSVLVNVGKALFK